MQKSTIRKGAVPVVTQSNDFAKEHLHYLAVHQKILRGRDDAFFVSEWIRGKGISKSDYTLRLERLANSNADLPYPILCLSDEIQRWYKPFLSGEVFLQGRFTQPSLYAALTCHMNIYIQHGEEKIRHDQMRIACVEHTSFNKFHQNTSGRTFLQLSSQSKSPRLGVQYQQFLQYPPKNFGKKKK
ncbi:MAG TPA: hypothetical protein VFM02_01165 [Candidatus Paceibacterota bacterium]|nr:hypothetical protein [Candidatus Paceibacterota bacterium]